MSTQVSEHLAGWESVQNALAEIRGNRGEFERFFAEVFDQLSSLSVELAGRQQAWSQQRRRSEEELGRQKSRLDEELAALTARQEQARQAADGRNEEERVTTAENTQQLGQLQQELNEARQQRQQWEQDRTILETELETVRNRAAEMAEMLAEQKRQAAVQQTEWAEELKRMRRLLETVCGQLTGRETASPDEAEPAAVTAAAADDLAAADPALDSVMAQFRMLQQDVARRRAVNCR